MRSHLTRRVFVNKVLTHLGALRGAVALRDQTSATTQSADARLAIGTLRFLDSYQQYVRRTTGRYESPTELASHIDFRNIADDLNAIVPGLRLDITELQNEGDFPQRFTFLSEPIEAGYRFTVVAQDRTIAYQCDQTGLIRVGQLQRPLVAGSFVGAPLSADSLGSSRPHGVDRWLAALTSALFPIAHAQPCNPNQQQQCCIDCGGHCHNKPECEATYCTCTMGFTECTYCCKFPCCETPCFKICYDCWFTVCCI